MSVHVPFGSAVTSFYVLFPVQNRSNYFFTLNATLTGSRSPPLTDRAALFLAGLGRALGLAPHAHRVTHSPCGGHHRSSSLLQQDYRAYVRLQPAHAPAQHYCVF